MEKQLTLVNPFLFHCKITPATMTGQSLAELLMGHQLKSAISLLTLDSPRSTAVAFGKHAPSSVGDSSRQAPTTHLCHTSSGLAQASRALTASFWYQQFRTNRAAILESGVVIHFEFFELQPFKVDQFFHGFFRYFPTLIKLKYIQK